MFKHILLATDGSAIAERAAALAVDLARVHGAKLTALHVVDPYPFVGIGASNPHGYQAYMSAAQECAAHAHARIKTLCESGGTAVPVTPLTVEDAVAYRGIVDAARSEGVDLVVVGSHGRTGLSRVVLGSVAARVVAEAPVPVLVVR